MRAEEERILKGRAANDNAADEEEEATPPPPTIKDLIDAIEKLSPESKSDEVTAALRIMVALHIDAVAENGYLNDIADKAGKKKAAIGSLRATIKAIRDDTRRAKETPDIGMEVANATMSKFFNGGQNLIRAIDRRFWVYNGTHWEPWTDDQLANRVLTTIHAVAKTLPPDAPTFSGIMSQAVSLLTAQQAADGDVLRLTEEPPPVINCQNGELWLSQDGTFELLPHCRESFLPYVLAVAYDPAATCPKFDKALLEIFGAERDGHAPAPEEMARHFMEFVGYLIQPVRDIESYWILIGRGANGKTKLMQTVHNLLGGNTVVSKPIGEASKTLFDKGDLAGKLMLLDDDVTSGTVLPDGFLKSVSERKVMSGSRKFKDTFEFTATIVPVMLANDYPKCKDLSWGNRRRAMIVPFHQVFDGASKDRKLFPDIWATEMPGILNRALEGLARLRKRGEFLVPGSCVRAYDRFLASASPVSAFVNECCIPTPGKRISGQVFYDRFEQWARAGGIKHIPSRNTLKRDIEDLGYAVEHSNAGSVIAGLDLIKLTVGMDEFPEM